MNRLVVKVLIYVEHRYPFLWRIVEWVNGFIFKLLYGREFVQSAAGACRVFSRVRYRARLLTVADLGSLEALLAAQAPNRLTWFHPHGFDRKSLSAEFHNPAFLMMGVFDGPVMAGYFFLRCFWTRKCFVGRLVDQEYEGLGIGGMMNEIMYRTGWYNHFRVLSTISRNNHRVMRAHAGNPALKVLKELRNDYLLVEFVPPAEVILAGEGYPIPGSMVLKRLFDFTLSLTGLVLLLPVLAVLAVLHKIVMPGAVFFRQQRVGQYGLPFTLIKFRTMVENPGGSTVSVKGERRITPFGALLRKYKIDELPELLNVLRGEMSFVGPRPDVSGYADRLRGELRRMLLLKPGLTGPATLKYAHEEELLASEPDPVGWNDRVIWPDKVRLNLEYLRVRSFWKDLRIIIDTLTGGHGPSFVH